jgi:hypothetical protein
MRSKKNDPTATKTDAAPNQATGSIKSSARQGKSARAPKGAAPKSGTSKDGIWETKYGLRRVRHDPPTLEEALIAASGLSDDASEQAEIAASLMGVPAERVRATMKDSAGAQKNVETLVLARGARGTRAVVVERKPARRMLTNRPVR